MHRMCTLTLLVSVAWSRMRRRDESESVKHHGGYRENAKAIKLEGSVHKLVTRQLTSEEKENELDYRAT